MAGKYIFHAAMGVVLLACFGSIGSLFWTRGLGMVDYRAAQVEAGQPGGYRGPALPADARAVRIHQAAWGAPYLLVKFSAPRKQLETFAWKLNAPLQPGVRLPGPEQFVHAAMLDDPKDEFHGIRRIHQGRSCLQTSRTTGTWHGICLVVDDATDTLYYMAW